MTESKRAYQCTGKFGFPAKGIARQVAKRMSGRGSALSVYRCDDCSAWHIGSRLRKPSAMRVKAGGSHAAK